MAAIEAEFHPCPDCRATLLVVNGRVQADGLAVEFHDRLTPTGVAPNRVTLHRPGCQTRRHLATRWLTSRPDTP